MNTTQSITHPNRDAERLVGSALILGGAASSAFAAKTFIATGFAAHLIPIIGSIVGIALMILGACLFYFSWKRDHADTTPSEIEMTQKQIEMLVQDPSTKEISFVPPERNEADAAKEDIQFLVPENVVSTPPVEQAPVETTTKDPLDLTTSDKLLTAANLVQLGLMGASLSGVGTAVTVPLGLIANLGADVLSYSQLPKDASLLRKVFSFPLVGKTILGYNPIIRFISQTYSNYNLITQSGSKLIRCAKNIKENPVKAVKNGTCHLFNLAFGTALAAESYGLIDLPRSPPVQKHSDSVCKPDARDNCKRKFVLGDAYSNNGDPMRDRYAEIIDQSHAEYAKKWGATHVVNNDTSLLKEQCIDPRTLKGSLGFKSDCSPYWLKIPALKQWLEEPRDPTVDEEWRILLDDDMPITNMTIDPNKIVDSLRGNNDSSVILVKDPNNWPVWFLPQPTDPKIAINGGLWFVRKDPRSLDFINKVWETRQTIHDLGNSHCPTLGLCMNQDALHEQQGTAMVLNKDPSLIDRVVSIVEPRDENSALRSDISLNTFHGHDNECYIRHRKGWSDNPYVHRLTSYNKNAAWKKGDWTGQVAAIPVYGKQLPVVNGQCVDSPDVPLGEIRYNKIKEIIDQTIR